MPAVNQVEVHPFFGNTGVRAYNAEHGIVTEAWAPIAKATILDDPVLVEVADRVGRTPAQVVLRWHLQRGDVIFPKTVTPSRLEENFALFDFALSNVEMTAITELDKGEDGRTGPHPAEYDKL